jgi:hypothetical protein
MERIPELSAELARRWPRCEGPLGDGWDSLSTVLHLLAVLERSPTSAVLDAHRPTTPELLRMARQWTGQPTERLRAMMLPEALDALWPELPGQGSAMLSIVDG